MGEQFDNLDNFEPIRVEKTASEMQLLGSVLESHFLFKNLDDKDLNIIKLACEHRNYKKGDIVIKEDDQGNEMFIVAEGFLDCHKIIDGKNNKGNLFKGRFRPNLF